MVFQLQSTNFEDYLAETPVLNYRHPAIEQLLSQLSLGALSDVEKARKLYEFVRDRIGHSWDDQVTTVTMRASDVAEQKTGICYAKANLLAALLRHEGIPAGFCYQRLMLFDTPEQGYYLHAFNAFYLQSHERWVFVDPRGNVFADFSLDEPSLAFTPDEMLGERTYTTIFTEPNARTIEVLQRATDALQMYANELPDEL